MGPYLLILCHSGPIPRDFMSQWACTPSSTYTVGTTIGICTTQTVQPLFLPYLYPYHPHHLFCKNCAASVPPLLTQWAHSSSFYGTVGLYPVILCHSGPVPHHLLTQWAPPSASALHKLSNLCSSLTYIPPHIMTQWAYTPIFTYTVGTTLAIYFTQTVQPQFLPYLHNGPIPPHFMTQWAYTLSITYIVGTTVVIYCTQTVQPHLLPYLHSGPILPHVMTKWAYTPSFTYIVGTTLFIYCTQTVHPHLLPYLHSGPIPPHFMTQWAYTPSFTNRVGTTRAIYCTQTAQPHFLYYLHSGPIPPHFMTQQTYIPHLLTQFSVPSFVVR